MGCSLCCTVRQDRSSLLGTLPDTSSTKQAHNGQTVGKLETASYRQMEDMGRDGKIKLGLILSQNNTRGSAVVSFLNMTQTYFATSEDIFNHLTNRNVKVTVFGTSDNRILNWKLKSRIDCAEGAE